MDVTEFLTTLRDFLAAGVPTLTRWLSRFWPLIPLLIVLRFLVGLLGRDGRRQARRRHRGDDGSDSDGDHDGGDSGGDGGGDGGGE